MELLLAVLLVLSVVLCGWLVKERRASRRQLQASQRQVKFLQGVLIDLNALLALLGKSQALKTEEVTQRMEFMTRTAGEFCQREERIKEQIQLAAMNYEGRELLKEVNRILEQ